MRISFNSFERCLPEVKNLVFLPYDSREKETIFIAIVLPDHAVLLLRYRTY